MTIKEKSVAKTVYETENQYIADDGTIFQNREECEAYENLDKKLNQLQVQKTDWMDDIFREFDSSEIDVYAVKIENAEQLEIVNEWIEAHDIYNYGMSLDKEVIGTIQLLLLDYENNVYGIGTPEQLKEAYCKTIDAWYNELVGETKGENV